jgi:hypothetical protein
LAEEEEIKKGKTPNLKPFDRHVEGFFVGFIFAGITLAKLF